MTRILTDLDLKDVEANLHQSYDALRAILPPSAAALVNQLEDDHVRTMRGAARTVALTGNDGHSLRVHADHYGDSDPAGDENDHGRHLVDRSARWDETRDEKAE